MDVDVVVHGEHWLWSFPGPDEALVEAFLSGAFPIGLSALWEEDAPEFAGEVRQAAEILLLDRVIDFECVRKTWSAVLYINDDDYSWTKLEAALVAEDGTHIHGPLGQLADRCRYFADGARITSLSAQALTDDDLVAVLRHPGTASLATLQFARPVSDAVREALASQPRPSLDRLVWCGDFGEADAAWATAQAPSLSTLKVVGRLAVWVNVAEIDAEAYPDIPPEGLAVSEDALRVVGLLTTGLRGTWGTALPDGVQVLQAHIDLDNAEELAALVAGAAELPPLQVLDLRGSGLAAWKIPDLRKALPAHVALLRSSVCPHLDFELHDYRDWMDWGLLFAFLDPVYEDWLSNLRQLAKKLGRPAQLKALKAASRKSVPMDKGFPKVRAALAALPVRGWQSLPAISTEHQLGAWLEETVPVLADVEGALFEGSVGNDYLLYVERWLPICVSTAGMCQGWLGDGYDGPVHDQTSAVSLGNQALRAARKAGSDWTP